MEATLTKDFIKGAIAAETENAKKNWGDTYHSEHEAWAVLNEEIEESHEELCKIANVQGVLWNFVKKQKDSEDFPKKKENLAYMKDCAMALAIEAVQIAAVAQKFIDTLEAQK